MINLFRLAISNTIMICSTSMYPQSSLYPCTLIPALLVLPFNYSPYSKQKGRDVSIQALCWTVSWQDALASTQAVLWSAQGPGYLVSVHICFARFRRWALPAPLCLSASLSSILWLLSPEASLPPPLPLSHSLPLQKKPSM